MGYVSQLSLPCSASISSWLGRRLEGRHRARRAGQVCRVSAMQMSLALTNSLREPRGLPEERKPAVIGVSEARNLVHGGPRAFPLGQPRVGEAILTGNGEKGGETANCDSRWGGTGGENQSESKAGRAGRDALCPQRSSLHSLPPQTSTYQATSVHRLRCKHRVVVNQTEKISTFMESHGEGNKQIQ